MKDRILFAGLVILLMFFTYGCDDPGPSDDCHRLCIGGSYRGHGGRGYRHWYPTTGTTIINPPNVKSVPDY